MVSLCSEGFTPRERKNRGTHSVGGVAGPRAGEDALKKGTKRVNNEVIKCVDAIGHV